MTMRKDKAKRTAVEELIAADRDLMKALMKEALQEVLEGEMSEFLGAAVTFRHNGARSFRRNGAT